jgi:hypothetical protein
MSDTPVFEQLTGDPAGILNQLGHRLENYRLVVEIEDDQEVKLGSGTTVPLKHCHLYYEVLRNGQKRLVAVIGIGPFDYQRVFAIPSEFE